MVNEMTFNNDELDNLLEEKLNLIQPTIPRDPETVRNRRNKYIREVKYLQFGKPVFAIAGLLNNKPWQTLFSQRPSFVPFAAAVLLIFGLVFGSVGTVYAAQDSLPNDLLYSIKLTGENLRLAFTPDTEARISLLTTFADRRMQEATALDSQGQPIPDVLPTLMDAYIAELLSLTDSLDETAVQEDPIAIHRRPQDRDQGRTNPMTGSPHDDKPPLDLDGVRYMHMNLHRIASTGDDDDGDVGDGDDGDGDVELNSFQNQFQQQFKHAQAGPPEAPNTYQQAFKHQQGITSTLTSTLTTTLTTTPEITVTLVITPGHYGPGGSCIEELGYCAPFGYMDPFGPFKGLLHVDEDHRGFGPGSDESDGPLQPSAPPQGGEPEQTPDPGSDKNSGKDKSDSGYKKGNP